MSKLTLEEAKQLAHLIAEELKVEIREGRGSEFVKDISLGDGLLMDLAAMYRRAWRSWKAAGIAGLSTGREHFEMMAARLKLLEYIEESWTPEDLT